MNPIMKGFVMAKIQPAVETMRFIWTPDDSGTTDVKFIDLSQCASLMNRRFYRQGLNWAVAGFRFYTNQLATDNASALKTIMIAKLPNTWVMHNAYKKAFKHWQQMNKEALEGMEGAKPKYLDFKIHANAEHYDAGYDRNLLPYAYRPVNLSSQQARPGEWTPSTFRIPIASSAQGGANDIIEYGITAVGPNYPQSSGVKSVSLIEGYASSRALIQNTDPNFPADAEDINSQTPENWLKAMINNDNAQLEEIIDDLMDEQDAPPYPIEGATDYLNGGTYSDTMYPGGANNMADLQLHDIERFTSTTIGGKITMKGGNFGCGLIAIKTENIDTSITMVVDLVPGHQRGYLTESMLK